MGLHRWPTENIPMAWERAISAAGHEKCGGLRAWWLEGCFGAGEKEQNKEKTNRWREERKSLLLEACLFPSLSFWANPRCFALRLWLRAVFLGVGTLAFTRTWALRSSGFLDRFSLQRQVDQWSRAISPSFFCILRPRRPFCFRDLP